MLSFVIPFRNRSPIAVACLQSVMDTARTLNMPDDIEFIFVDDASEPGFEVVPLMLELRKQTSSNVRIIHFKERQHYTRGCAHLLSLAKGDVFFLSHDMVLTASCVSAVLQVAAMSPSHGIVRATSNQVDCFPEHEVRPSLALRHTGDIQDFSRYVADYYKLKFTEDALLTGDIMLIRREVLDKIGVFDTRYFGYFGDVDYGLRAQRAGFKLVCAKGAWVFHEGAGYYKQEAVIKQESKELNRAHRMEVVKAAYRVFREKWDLFMQTEYSDIKQIDFNRLRTLPPAAYDAFQPPVSLTANVGELM